MNNFKDSFQVHNPLENFHILLWLIKDICWVLELRWLGACMVLPTVLIALYIVVKTYKTPIMYVNFSVLFWIIANSFWMMAEFFNFVEYKHYALIPFSLGIISFGIYIIRLKLTDTNK